MTFFETIKFRLRRLGIFQAKFDPKAKKKTIIKRCALYSIFVSLFLSSAWYRVFKAQTLIEQSENMIFVLGSVKLLTWYSAFVFQSEKYEEILDELNAIIAQRMTDPTINLIYEFANVKIEWMTKKLFIVFEIFTWIFVSIPAILSLCNYVTSGLSSDSLKQTYPASYPFDWKTPHGYVASFFIQAASMLAAAEIYGTGIMITIGVSMQIANFASDIKEKLRQFNRILTSSKEGDELSADDQVTIRKKLNEIIEFHSEAREFAHRFSDVNSAVVFACPTFVIAIFGCLVLQIKELTKTGDVVDILHIGIIMVFSLFSFFLFCHYGGKITQQFEEIGDAFYQLEWYRLPVKMQNDLRVVIALSQKRIFMRGYGGTRTTYSVFKKVIFQNISDFTEQSLLLVAGTQNLIIGQCKGEIFFAAVTPSETQWQGGRMSIQRPALDAVSSIMLIWKIDNVYSTWIYFKRKQSIN